MKADECSFVDPTSFLSILWWRMMNETPIGRPRGYIYALGKPWGVPYLALHSCTRSSWERSKLSFHKISLAQIFLFAALPCRHHISYVHTPNNANSVSTLCGTKLYSTLVFIGFLGNKDKIPKMVSQDNLSDFGLVCIASILGAKFPSFLDRIGISICPNRSSRHGPQLW
jgi:hypothetical protein